MTISTSYQVLRISRLWVGENSPTVQFHNCLSCSSHHHLIDRGLTAQPCTFHQHTVHLLQFINNSYHTRHEVKKMPEWDGIMKLFMNQESKNRQIPIAGTGSIEVPKILTLDPVLWIRIRIQEGKNNPKTRKKLINFVFWSAGCSLWTAKGFSYSLDVLYVGLAA